MRISSPCSVSTCGIARHALLFFLWYAGAFPLSAQSLQRGDSLAQAGRFRDAIEAFQIFIEQNPGRVYDHSVAWLGISQNYLQTGAVEEAIAANDRSIAIREQLRSDDAAENYLRYGIIDLYAGRLESALENLAQAKALPAVDPLQFALMEELMADAYAGLNNPREALRHYDLWLESLLAELGENHPQVSEALHKIGRLYLSRGMLSDAKDELQRALSAEQRNGRSEGQTVRILNALGELAWQEAGHRVARSFFIRAYTAQEAADGVSREDIAATCINLARAALAGAELQEAAAYVQQAMYALYPGFDAEDLASQPDPSAPALDRILAAQAHALKARYFSALKGPGFEAIAMGCFAAAISLLEEASVVGGSYDAAKQLGERTAPILEAAVNAALKANDPALAFEWLERSKVILLRSRYLLPAMPAHGSAAEEKQLRQAIHEAEFGFRAHPGDASKTRDAAESKAAFFRFCDSLRAAEPHYFHTRLARPRYFVAEVQSQLDEHTAVLSFFHRKDQRHAIVLTRAHCIAEPLPEDETYAWQTTIANYLRAIEQDKAEDFVLHSGRLYDMLIAPVKKALAGQNKFVILTHGNAPFIPFEALLTSPAKVQPGKVQYAKLPYFAKQFSVQYHLAAPFLAIPAGAAAEVEADLGFVTRTPAATMTKTTSIAKTFLTLGKSGLLVFALPHPGAASYGAFRSNYAKRHSAGKTPAQALAETKRAWIKKKQTAAPSYWSGIILLGQ